MFTLDSNVVRFLGMGDDVEDGREPEALLWQILSRQSWVKGLTSRRSFRRWTDLRRDRVRGGKYRSWRPLEKKAYVALYNMGRSRSSFL
ncbi:Trafficking protein particle complex subunit BET3 [Fusarium oxysporum f. sp. albedinis]|nr:Trafficking protein particle complex subunit BET3 [Fusarium oxysporum f. sp. albedinis]